MSFSREVKEELLKQSGPAEHCIYAELAALALFGERGRAKAQGAGILPENGQVKVFLNAENDFVKQKAFTLCRKNITIKVDIENGSLMIPAELMRESLRPDLNGTLKRSCCRRAFLRGAYLSIGSMSNPGKSYHLEFDCVIEEQAKLLQQMIADFDIPAKIARRKKYYVVYVKEGSAICDMLNIMGAHVSLMDFENYRIVKEVRNSVNRKVNCETANITKTVNAAAAQVRDIELIQKTCGFGELSETLREIAELRLEYQEATLQELGDLLTPPVGKSGVNHRLRKLSLIAESIRQQ
ncbi:MAG: DNA-binding protein WhiA [Lachnospiraceae bacterium]|nr:DNA-binding protein WhiA [Lachnospiraceae bacterium]